MKILILEDNQERIKLFKEWFKEHDLTICETAKECLSKLHIRYDWIFLDHDLGGEIFVDSDEENTGYQVAKKIPDTINKDTDIIIHSLNYVGAMRMKNKLKNVKYVPFGTWKGVE